jgi:aspartate/tyrosine/aromatic aminotransferase
MPFSIPSPAQDIILQRSSEYHLIPGGQQKINGIIGVLLEPNGDVYIPHSIRGFLEKNNLSRLPINKTFNYAPAGGYPKFGGIVKSILSERIDSHSHWSCIQTPGGTGALHLASRVILGIATTQRPSLLLSDPTWPIHHSIFHAVQFKKSFYKHAPVGGQATLLSDEFLNALDLMEKDSAVLMQLSGHNPTGLRVELETWKQAIDIIKSKSLKLVIDIAYFGLGDCPHYDRQIIDLLESANIEFFVTFSFSKNTGLYGHRCGALLWHSPSTSRASRMQSYFESLASGLWLTPPTFSAAVVTAALETEQQRTAWLNELKSVRSAIESKRAALAKVLDSCGLATEETLAGTGLFTLLPLSSEQIEDLYRNWNVFVEPSFGRFTVTSLNSDNLAYFADALRQVTPKSVQLTTRILASDAPCCPD